MAGRWEGTASAHYSDGDGDLVLRASMRVYNVLDGCSILRFLNLKAGEGKTYRNFAILTYNKSTGQFEELSLDSNVASPARLYRGKLADGLLEVTAEGRQEGLPRLFHHSWSLPQENDRIRLESTSSADGKEWRPDVSIQLVRVDEDE